MHTVTHNDGWKSDGTRKTKEVVIFEIGDTIVRLNPLTGKPEEFTFEYPRKYQSRSKY